MGVILSSKEYLSMSVCHNCGGAAGIYKQRPAMRLNTLQCKGQNPTTKDTKDYPAPNVHSAEAEKC